MRTFEQVEAGFEVAKKEGFERFMAQPLFRALAAQIPPLQGDETLKLLIEAAYFSGFERGTMAMAGDVAREILRERGPDGGQGPPFRRG